MLEMTKLRDYSYVTGKYWCSDHWSSNINYNLTKNIPAILHSLKDYDSHLMMQEIENLDVKINVIPDGLE